MIRKTIITAMGILACSFALSLLLSMGQSEADMFELKEIASFPIEPLQIEGENLNLISRDVPEFSWETHVYVPKVWQEKYTGDKPELFSVEQNGGTIEFHNPYNIRPVLAIGGVGFFSPGYGDDLRGSPIKQEIYFSEKIPMVIYY